MKYNHVIFTLTVLCVNFIVAATDIRLKNGVVYKGEIVKEDDRFFSLKIGKSTRAINKILISEIDGEPYSPVASAASSVHVKKNPPPKKSGKVTTNVGKKPVSSAGRPSATKDLWHVVLKNGTTFKGKRISENKRLLVLESKGSPVSIFRNMIASIDSGQGMKPRQKVAVSSAPDPKHPKTSKVKSGGSALPAARKTVSGDSAPVTVKEGQSPSSEQGAIHSPVRMMVTSMNQTKPSPESYLKKKSTSVPAEVKVKKDSSHAAAGKKFTTMKAQFGEKESKEESDTLNSARAEIPQTVVTLNKLPQPHPRMTVVSFEKQVPKVRKEVKKTPGSINGAVKKTEEKVALQEDVSSAGGIQVVPAPLPAFVKARKRSGSAAQKEKASAEKETTAIINKNAAPDATKKRTETVSGEDPVSPGSDTTDKKSTLKVVAVKSKRKSSGVEIVKPVEITAPVVPVSVKKAEDTVVAKRSVKEQTPAQAVLPMAPSAKKKPAVKRKDGKQEILLENGTRFVGKIRKDADHSIAFVSEGAVITILKNLIKEIDGKPYIYKRRKKENTRAQASASRSNSTMKKQQKSTAQRILFRIMPVVDMPEGITVESLRDTMIKGDGWKERSRAARIIGAMGPWGISAIPDLVALLDDTTGQKDAAPLSLDSIEALTLLSPGLESARALAQLGNQGAGELVKAFRSDNVLVRRNVVFGFGNCFFDVAVKNVKKAVADPDAGVRRNALSSLRVPDAMPFLASACKDRNASVRAAAASLLGKMNNKEAVKLLEKMVRDRSAMVRSAVASALVSVSSDAFLSSLSVLSRDKDNLVRATAVRSLKHFEDTSIIDICLAAAQDSSVEVRIAAVEALRKIKSSRSIPIFYSLINDSNEQVRQIAGKALKEHTEIELLIQALDDESNLVRSNVAYILWLMTAQEFGQDKTQWSSWAASRQTKKGTAAKSSLVEKK